MPISDHVAAPRPEAVQEAVTEVRARIAEARDRGGHGQEVTLVAVTKTHGPEAVEAAWQAGVTDVGENRVQEAESKMASVSVPVRWHLIGHLQRNKAKHALRFALVHGLDSERLAVALHDEAVKAGQTLDVLVQVNVSGEASKSGLPLAEVPAFADRLQALPSLRVRGRRAGGSAAAGGEARLDAREAPAAPLAPPAGARPARPGPVPRALSLDTAVDRFLPRASAESGLSSGTSPGSAGRG